MKTKRVLYTSAIIIGTALLGVCFYINSLLPIITGYAAKNLCSNVFISGREPEDIEAVDLNFSFIRFTKNSVDYNEKSVTSRFLWGRSKAIYRNGFGSTLLKEIPEADLRKSLYPVNTNPGYSQDTTEWPLGNVLPDSLPSGIDISAVSNISKKVIDENGYGGNAFAFMVVHKGIPVAEVYKPQFDQNTRFLSWSMAKSFTNAVIGVLVKIKRMDISEPTGIEVWKGDDRSRITINDLLQMQSGLKWNEDYGSRSDVNQMLFNEGDMSRFSASKPLKYPPGTHWYYSSGSVNILTYLIRKEFIDYLSYYTFIQDQVFEKIGITDAVFEVDPSGDFVGSSYLYATARDYARFGLLYLNDGLFGGERVLPEGWVSYTRERASDSNGGYGALFWLNQGRRYPSAPADMFSCEGHDGQLIFILPSNDLVVVILGFSHKPDNEMDLDRLLRDILGTLKQ